MGVEYENLFRKVIAKYVTADLTIPIGGGQATTSISPSDMGVSKIETIISIKAPDGIIGLTLAAGTGTTLVAEVLAIGTV